MRKFIGAALAAVLTAIAVAILIPSGAWSKATGFVGQIMGNQILDGTIDTADLAAGAVTGVKIAAGTVVASDIGADEIDGTELADTIVLDATLGITSGAAEGIAMTHAMTNDTTENAILLTVTSSDTGGSTTGQYGIYIDNAASTEGLDAGIVIDNSDADDAIVTGILFVDGGGGFTTGINTAGASITSGGGTITGRVPVVSSASGALVMNTITLATAGATDHDVPDATCAVAGDIGTWFTVVVEDASTVVEIQPLDVSNILIVEGLAQSAGDEVDSCSSGTENEGCSITFTCLAADQWYATAQSGTWAVGGGAD
jgi:hypothetical protein